MFVANALTVACLGYLTTGHHHAAPVATAEANVRESGGGPHAHAQAAQSRSQPRLPGNSGPRSVAPVVVTGTGTGSSSSSSEAPAPAPAPAPAATLPSTTKVAVAPASAGALARRAARDAAGGRTANDDAAASAPAAATAGAPAAAASAAASSDGAPASAGAAPPAAASTGPALRDIDPERRPQQTPSPCRQAPSSSSGGGGGLGACGVRSSTELCRPRPSSSALVVAPEPFAEPAYQLPEVKAAAHRSGRIQLPSRTAFDAVHG